MNLIKYFTAKSVNETFLIKKKAKALVISSFVSVIYLFLLIFFIIKSAKYQNQGLHILIPSTLILLIFADLYVLKKYSYKKAAYFLTVTITLAVCVQLFIVKPQYELGDYTSTFYFIFAVISAIALFSPAKIYATSIILILISLSINIIRYYNDFMHLHEKRFIIIITYYILAIALVLLFITIQRVLFQRALKRTGKDNKRILHLNRKLISQNKNLQQIVEKRTQ